MGDVASRDGVDGTDAMSLKEFRRVAAELSGVTSLAKLRESDYPPRLYQQNIPSLEDILGGKMRLKFEGEFSANGSFQKLGDEAVIKGGIIKERSDYERFDAFCRGKKKVAFAGQFKVGKSTQMNLLRGLLAFKGHEVNNTKGLDILVTGNYMLMDTEGFNQPLDVAEPYVKRDFIMSQLREWCDALVIVVDRLTVQDLQLLDETTNYFVSGGTLHKLIVLHNVKTIRSRKGLENHAMCVKKTLSEMRHDTFEDFSGNPLYFQQFPGKKTKGVSHHFIGDMTQNARKWLDSLEHFAFNLTATENSIKSFSKSIILSCNNVLGKYFDCDSCTIDIKGNAVNPWIGNARRVIIGNELVARGRSSLNVSFASNSKEKRLYVILALPEFFLMDVVIMSATTILVRGCIRELNREVEGVCGYGVYSELVHLPCPVNENAFLEKDDSRTEPWVWSNLGISSFGSWLIELRSSSALVNLLGLSALLRGIFKEAPVDPAWKKIMEKSAERDAKRGRAIGEGGGGGAAAVAAAGGGGEKGAAAATAGGGRAAAGRAGGGGGQGGGAAAAGGRGAAAAAGAGRAPAPNPAAAAGGVAEAADPVAAAQAEADRQAAVAQASAREEQELHKLIHLLRRSIARRRVRQERAAAAPAAPTVPATPSSSSSSSADKPQEKEIKTAEAYPGVFSEVPDRQNWENKMATKIIEPLISADGVAARLEAAAARFAPKGDEEGSVFVAELMERYDLSAMERKVRASTWPALLRYRQPFSITDFTMELNLHADNSTKYPVLSRFLADEPEMRALGGLPAVINWQSMLMAKYNRVLTDVQVKEKTVRDVLESAPSGERRKWENAFEGFANAWNKCWQYVKRFECIEIPPEYRSIDMHKDRSIGFCLPTNKDEGVCSIALTRFLGQKHNDFLGVVDELLLLRGEELQRTGESEKAVSTKFLAAVHTLAYDLEGGFIPFVEKQCVSYTAAGGLQYDFRNAEQYLLDVYFTGKPVIEIEMRAFQFANELGTITTTLLKQKVQQVPLSKPDQAVILRELGNPSAGRRALELLETCIQIIQTTGGSTVQTLDIGSYLLLDYVKGVLMMKDATFGSDFIHTRIALKHIDGLWILLRDFTVVNPFATVRPKYKQPLTKQQTDDLLDACSEHGGLDLGVLMPVFKSMIIEYMSEDTLGGTVKDALAYCMADRDSFLSDLEWFEEFPGDIPIAQALETFKLLESCHTD
eukprot:gb/GEZN01000419.1/.p1 GENE.gb/GEZN01000419.1/~~gb/GEZN01000419.1/.p1  ORF type:complete len:1217 (-),score=225.46 gb/GEZN01000419.1/:414-4064(-)